jgi:voltage-gated potassium channel
MLWAEGSAPDASITTGQDAIWYLIVTMSTVGYGDLYPVTDLGRLIGSVIIVVGVGVFGTLTGFLANAFMAPASDDEEEVTAETAA